MCGSTNEDPAGSASEEGKRLGAECQSGHKPGRHQCSVGRLLEATGEAVGSGVSEETCSCVPMRHQGASAHLRAVAGWWGFLSPVAGGSIVSL